MEAQIRGGDLAGSNRLSAYIRPSHNVRPILTLNISQSRFVAGFAHSTRRRESERLRNNAHVEYRLPRSELVLTPAGRSGRGNFTVPCVERVGDFHGKSFFVLR